VTAGSATGIALACPACGAALPDPARCTGCGREFEFVAGLPDLRLEYPDPTVSREEDNARARELAAAAEELDFADLLRLHWRMSDRPAALAERFVASDLGAMARSAEYLDAIEVARGRPFSPEDALLEVGCGTAPLALAAAARGCEVTATDISMRWVVLARKRVADTGAERIALVCSSAEQAPFPEGSFDVVVASDVIEHAASQRDFVAGCARMLKPGGILFLATPNRFSLGLEPHVRLWGVGLLPRPIAKRYVRAVRKSGYDHVHLRSALGLHRLLRSAGLRPHIVPPEIPPATQELYNGLELRLVRTYNRLRRYAPVRAGLLAVGPFFHVFARKGPS
jgi:2-polyprenyl-3-methyl-5-hydroxy-6-metoxy-1,4-benzoquinol methylase